MKNKILILVLLVVVVSLGYFVWSKEVVAPTKELGDGNNAELAVFTNEQYGFSFQYPKDFEVGDDRINLPPDYEEFIPAKSLVRKIPVKHCGLSGLPEHCSDFTNNPKITVTVVNSSFDQLVKEMTAALGEPERAELNGRQFSVWSMGVEGEGENRYFTKLSDSLSLVLSYSYIDQNVVGLYQNAPDFWSLDKQKTVFEAVASSLKVN